jgi:hypothetical protein
MLGSVAAMHFKLEPFESTSRWDCSDRRAPALAGASRSGIILRAMRIVRRVALFSVLSIVLGLVLAEGVGLYVQFVMDETECAGETWIGRAVCGDSAYAVIAVCIGSAAVLVVGGSYLVRRLRRPNARLGRSRAGGRGRRAGGRRPS